MLPSLIGLLTFVMLPVLASLSLTFFRWDGLGGLSIAKWTGLDNYTTMFSDSTFYLVLKNTGYFGVLSLLGIVPSLLLAVQLQHSFFGRTLFRVVFFLPYVATGVAVAMVWRWLLDSEIGAINYLLEAARVHKVQWLNSREWALPSVALVQIWRHLGYFMLLFLSGLQSIPAQYYEAARADGAGPVSLFRHITLPLLSPTTFFIVVVTIIQAFRLFDLILLMTGGGPAMATTTVAYYIYTNSFEDFRLGYGSALAWGLFVIVGVITFVQMHLQRRWVHYER